METPNKIVKLVFEQIGDIEDDESVVGLKVFLEYDGRKITEDILSGSDKTAAEAWATEMFELTSNLLHEKAENTPDLEVYTDFKKENLN